MAEFVYEALTREGGEIRGTIAADTPAQAAARLQARGLIPVHTRPAGRSGPGAAWKRGKAGGRRLPAGEVAAAAGRLAALLAAGLPADRAIEILVEGAGSGAAVWRRVLECVRAGTSLADAMAAEGTAFPPMLVGMVRAGEAAGTLPVVLARLAEHLARQRAFGQTLRSALLYPAVLVAVAGASILFILTVVLPRFEPIFAEAGDRLPASTRALLAAGHFLDDWGSACALALLAGGFGLRAAFRLPRVRRAADALVLRLPFAGRLVAKAETARLARGLGTMVANGVPLTRALDIARGVLGNRVFAEVIGAVAVKLKEGRGLAGPMAASGLVPPTAVTLIRLGEETGRLGDMLLNVADLHEGELHRTLTRLSTLMVPVLTIVLGAGVAGIVASVFLALLGINELAA